MVFLDQINEQMNESLMKLQYIFLIKCQPKVTLLEYLLAIYTKYRKYEHLVNEPNNTTL